MKKDILGGEVFTIPLDKLGYCTGVVSRPAHAETGLIHVYLRLELTDKPFTNDSIGLPQAWSSAWIGLLTSKSIASGRWPIVGRLADFDPTIFTIPPLRNIAEIHDPDGPAREVCSIQTTLDEPSLTVIDNVAAARDEAMRFPPLQIVIAGSNLEKSLVRLFRKMGFTFHDVPIEGTTVSTKDIAYWNAHAKKAREAFDPKSVKWLPAGSKTDRAAKAGDWFGFALPGGGFGAAIMLARPDKHQRVFADSIMLSMRRRWNHWPTLRDVESLRAEHGAIIRQMSLIAVRDGLWRGLGAHPDFDSARWPWPIPWHVEHGDEKKTLVSLRFGDADQRYARIVRSILDLDPEAGDTINAMSSGSGIAHDTYKVIQNISFRRTSPRAVKEKGVVTPERLAAWTIINAAVRDAMKRAVKRAETRSL